LSDPIRVPQEMQRRWQTLLAGHGVVRRLQRDQLLLEHQIGVHVEQRFVRRLLRDQLLLEHQIGLHVGQHAVPRLLRAQLLLEHQNGWSDGWLDVCDLLFGHHESGMLRTYSLHLNRNLRCVDSDSVSSRGLIDGMVMVTQMVTPVFDGNKWFRRGEFNDRVWTPRYLFLFCTNHIRCRRRSFSSTR